MLAGVTICGRCIGRGEGSAPNKAVPRNSTASTAWRRILNNSSAGVGARLRCCEAGGLPIAKAIIVAGALGGGWRAAAAPPEWSSELSSKMAGGSPKRFVPCVRADGLLFQAFGITRRRAPVAP